MEKQFVPYEFALKLKEKGFCENTLGYYIDGDFTYFMESEGGGEWVNAPLYQQVIDWFREKYDIHIHISRTYCYVGDKPRTFDGWCVYIDNGIEDSDLECNSKFIETFYPTYYEALTKAIEEALKLIE